MSGIQYGPMARTHRGYGFKTVANEVDRDQRLSCVARSCFNHLASHQPGWETSADRMAKHYFKESKDTLQKGLAELERYGYLTRCRDRSAANGKLGGINYILCDIPDDTAFHPSADPEPESSAQGTTSGNTPSSQRNPKTADGGSGLPRENGSFPSAAPKPLSPERVKAAPKEEQPEEDQYLEDHPEGAPGESFELRSHSSPSAPSVREELSHAHNARETSPGSREPGHGRRAESGGSNGGNGNGLPGADGAAHASTRGGHATSVATPGPSGENPDSHVQVRKGAGAGTHQCFNGEDQADPGTARGSADADAAMAVLDAAFGDVPGSVESTDGRNLVSGPAGADPSAVSGFTTPDSRGSEASGPGTGGDARVGGSVPCEADTRVSGVSVRFVEWESFMWTRDDGWPELGFRPVSADSPVSGDTNTSTAPDVWPTETWEPATQPNPQVEAPVPSQPNTAPYTGTHGFSELDWNALVGLRPERYPKSPCSLGEVIVRTRDLSRVEPYPGQVRQLITAVDRAIQRGVHPEAAALALELALDRGHTVHYVLRGLSREFLPDGASSDFVWNGAVAEYAATPAGGTAASYGGSSAPSGAAANPGPVRREKRPCGEHSRWSVQQADSGRLQCKECVGELQDELGLERTRELVQDFTGYGVDLMDGVDEVLDAWERLGEPTLAAA